jgi:hypothetical protein
MRSQLPRVIASGCDVSLLVASGDAYEMVAE